MLKTKYLCFGARKIFLEIQQGKVLDVRNNLDYNVSGLHPLAYWHLKTLTPISTFSLYV